jgi:hypothetical protein
MNETIAYNICQIFGTTMALCDSRVAVLQQRGNGIANNVATPKNDRGCPRKGHTSRFQKSNDCQRGAWSEQRKRRTGREMSDIMNVETV